MNLALLGICHRTVKASFPKISRHLLDAKHAPPTSRTIGDRLRLERIYRGLKQSELASMIDVTTRTIMNWEQNQTLNKPMNQAKILDFLNVKPCNK